MKNIKLQTTQVLSLSHFLSPHFPFSSFLLSSSTILFSVSLSPSLTPSLPHSFSYNPTLHTHSVFTQSCFHQGQNKTKTENYWLNWVPRLLNTLTVKLIISYLELFFYIVSSRNFDNDTIKSVWIFMQKKIYFGYIKFRI